MNIIALLINVSAHDWTAESAIIASNVLGTFGQIIGWHPLLASALRLGNPESATG